MSKIFKPLLGPITGLIVDGKKGFIRGLTGAIAALSGPLGFGLYLASNWFAKTPKSNLGQLDRLSASIDPGAFRPMVLGTTAMATDIRYVEPSGDDQEYLDYIIGVACHKVTSIDEIWIEDRVAWTSAGGVQGDFVGYLSVTTRTEGTSANTIAINGGTKWGSTRRLTGCAYVHLRIKRTGNSKKAESPFASGLASRITIKGKGQPVYDPRRDSTAGGSGSMRATDQSTWSFAPSGTEIGNNAALLVLAYLLGWKIGGLISVGCGVLPSRINMASFIAAANLCDELVSKAAGGTEPRYRAAGVITEGDDPQQALQALLAACNGRLRDDGGRLSLAIMHNDLAAAELDDGFFDGDVLGAFEWDPDPDLAGSFNIVRGKRTDPSNASLYQPIDYPEVSVASIDGIDRVLTMNLLLVESPSQAQRIAKQVLQRKLYDRRFTATFSNRAWKYRIGDVIPLTFGPLGFDRALFRVEQQTITYDGSCPMVLVFEHEDIYAWDDSDAAPVVGADPTLYDPLNDPLIQGIGEALQQAIAAIAAAENAQDTADGKIETFYQNNPPSGLGESEGDLWFDTNDTNKLYTYRSGTWVLTADTRVAAAITAAAGAQATADGRVTTFYTNSTPTANAVGDLWYSSSTNRLRRWNGSTWVDVATIGSDWATNLTNIPTAIGDGRVDAGLNSDGTIKTGKVPTLSVQIGALSTRAAIQPAGATTGSGSTVSVGTIFVTNSHPTESAVAMATALGSHDYPGSPPSWDFVIAKNGVGAGMTSGGGAGIAQVSAVAGRMDTIPPSTTIQYDLLWRGGNSGIRLASAIMSVDSVKRNA